MCVQACVSPFCPSADEVRSVCMSVTFCVSYTSKVGGVCDGPYTPS